jgi:nicotinamide mononucleotide transporter
VVGVPLLVQAKFYPSATMYVVYGLFCVVGFAAWWRIQNRVAATASTPEPVVVG